tara:strand:- start:236 stop:559 length:324 start_codon:yes stop_codon:yes gene_type:complete
MKDLDYQTGILESYSVVDKKIKVHKTQDVNPFLNANKQEINNQSTGFKGDMHKMASIPPIVLEMWREDMKKKGYPNSNPLAVSNRKYLLSKLNSPDWNFLRTKQGVI